VIAARNSFDCVDKKKLRVHSRLQLVPIGSPKVPQLLLGATRAEPHRLHVLASGDTALFQTPTSHLVHDRPVREKTERATHGKPDPKIAVFIDGQPFIKPSRVSQGPRPDSRTRRVTDAIVQEQTWKRIDDARLLDWFSTPDQKARTGTHKHNVRKAVERHCYDHKVVRTPTIVRVEKRDNLAPSKQEAGIASSRDTSALLPVVTDTPINIPKSPIGTVGRSIIDDDHLEVRVTLSQNTRNGSADVIPSLVGGDHNADRRPTWHHSALHDAESHIIPQYLHGRVGHYSARRGSPAARRT
jgi:hypothetical protein